MANGDDDEPETFTCRLTIVCDGGPHQISELSSKSSLTAGRVGECHACNRARTAQTDALKLAINRRLGFRTTVGSESWVDWRALPQATRTALLAEERRRAEEGTSTVNALPEFNLNPQEEAEEEVNDSIATHQDMPSPDSGGHQTTERDGHLYIITHTRYEGWLTIGHSRSPNARRGGYNRSDPYRRYVTRHTVYVQDQRVAEMIAHAAASAHGSCEEARGEWFRMDLDAAIAILNQLGTPPENGD